MRSKPPTPVQRSDRSGCNPSQGKPPPPSAQVRWTPPLLALARTVSELPQVGRYFPDEFYRAHYDAFDLATPDGQRFAQNGGQRVGTVLVYLNDVAASGHTSFSKLGLSIQPDEVYSVVNL